LTLLTEGCKWALVRFTALVAGELIYNVISEGDDCDGDSCPTDSDGEGDGKGNGERDTKPPYNGPPNGYEEGPRRGREYGPDGTPVRDYDNPHQGADYPHVHEWPGGDREHPGRPYSPLN